MAGKKKKKPAANPARGVATVSIPSKPKDVAADLDTSSGVDKDPISESMPTRLKAPDPDNTGQPEVVIEKMTPKQLEAHLEEEELRLFVDQNATTVKSSAARHASKLQNERRQLRAHADRAFVTGVMATIIDDVLQMGAFTEPKRFDGPHSFRVDDFQILLKLWTLQEVLVQLKMPFITNALAYALSCRFHSQKGTGDQVTGLTEVFEWYAGHMTPNDLPDYETGVTLNTVEQDVSGEERVSLDKPTEMHNDELKTKCQSDNAESLDELPHEFYLSESDNEDDSNDPALLVERWTKMNYNRQKRIINRKIDAINRDLLFDRQAADEQWKLVHRNLKIQVAQAERKISEEIKHDVSQVTETESEHVELDLMLGDMFNSEQLQSTDGSFNKSTIIEVRDFGEWFGLHPHRVLQDICSKNSDSIGLKFTPLQITSYSARLKLTLSWARDIVAGDAIKLCMPHCVQFDSFRHAWSISMHSIAAANVSQAEAFLSTLALFMLDNEGQSTVKASALLPKTWRDMYMDLRESLEEVRKKEDMENLKMLREMIRDSDSQEQSRGVQFSKGKKGEAERQQTASDAHFSWGKLSAAETIELWQNRASSPSFQRLQPLRMGLPVFAYKEAILQTFEQNQITLVCADTGAGKSTQIPSYVLERGLSQGQDIRILVTQPRRISAVSIARRVSEELGEDRDSLGSSRSLVGYAIRLESKLSASTRLTFATTGVLLRMLQDSFNLEQYDCLILDEVHERTMDLDLIFIALKQLQTRRSSLKIILMSATIEINKFSAYFDNCPVLQIPGRTYPVEIGFLEDAIEETLDLQDSAESSQDAEEWLLELESNGEESTVEYAPTGKTYSAATSKLLKEYDHSRMDYQLILKLATAIATNPKYEQYSKAILIFMPGLAEIRRLNDVLTTAKIFSTGWTIHLLHSSFSTEELEKAFHRPSPGFRKIVIATNIAETGITIPDVTTVIDTCKEKVMRFDERRQLSRLTEGMISRSSARQRRGRAARVQNGLCFHLIPKYYHDHKIPEQSTPEMLRLSLQQPLLRIKIWNLGSIEEVLSAALDPPTTKNIHKAISKLKDVGAIDSTERLTPLGKLLAKLPLDVALGKMAIYGVLFQSLDATVTVIAITSVKSIFTESRTARDYSQTTFASDYSDLMITYKVYCGWRRAVKAGTGQQFCRNQHLSYPQLLQVEEQKIQLLVYLSDAGLIFLNDREKSALNHARTSKRSVAEFDIPWRYNRLNNEDMMAGVIAVAFHPKILRRDIGSAYRNVYTNQYLQLTSTIREKAAGLRLPKWVCYMEAIQIKSGKLSVLNSSKITEPLIIALLGDAEFNLFAGVVTIDNGNIRIALRQWKEMLAFKRLREQFRKIVTAFLTNPSAITNSGHVQWLDLMSSVLQKAL